jgi:hypothetical protein
MVLNHPSQLPDSVDPQSGKVLFKKEDGSNAQHLRQVI